MAARRSRRRRCAHCNDPRTCAECAVARWRLLLASARVELAARHLSAYSERSEFDQLRRCLKGFYVACGYYRAVAAPEASARGLARWRRSERGEASR